MLKFNEFMLKENKETQSDLLFGDLPDIISNTTLSKQNRTSITKDRRDELIRLGHEGKQHSNFLKQQISDIHDTMGRDLKDVTRLQNKQIVAAYEEGERRAKITPYTKEMYITPVSDEYPKFIRDFLNKNKNSTRAINQVTYFIQAIERIKSARNEDDFEEGLLKFSVSKFEDDSTDFWNEFYSTFNKRLNKLNLEWLPERYMIMDLKTLGKKSDFNGLDKFIKLYQLSGMIEKCARKIFDTSMQSSIPSKKSLDKKDIAEIEEFAKHGDLNDLRDYAKRVGIRDALLTIAIGLFDKTQKEFDDSMLRNVPDEDYI